MKNTFFVAIRLLIGIVFPLLHMDSLAQNADSQMITGKIVNKSNEPLELANVKLLHAKDSSIAVNVQTNKAGQFSIAQQTPGNYIIKISLVGFRSAIKSITVYPVKITTDVGTVFLEEGIDLHEIVILGETPPMKLMKDTIEYNAGSFKTAPSDNVEDLVKKMPGIDVDMAGNIKAQGQDVSKVTVEGKDFFGTDPKVATRNLPADAISKVQIIDDKTEQSKVTGIDDGTRRKVMNLILKEEKKGGWFGSTSIAGGTGDHYLGSSSLNHFTKEKQLNFLLMSNNINQSYSAGEVSNFSGNNFGTGAISGSAGGVEFGRTSQGFTKTNSGAANFSDTWGRNNKIIFNSSYVGSLVNTDTRVQSDIQNIQSGGVFFNQNQSVTGGDNQSHELNFRVSAPLDSLTNVSIYSSGSLGVTNSTGISSVSTRNNIKQLINNGSQNIVTDASAPAFSGSLTLSRRMKQKKGTIALTLRQNYSKRISDITNNNTTDYYQNGNFNDQKIIDQHQDLDALNTLTSVQSSVSRVISKDRKTSLVFNVAADVSNRNSDQQTYEYNVVTGLYETLAPQLTSNYKNRLIQYASALGINKATDKLTVNIFTYLQNTILEGNVKSNNQLNELSKSYWAILPRLNLSYRKPNRTTYTFSLSSSYSVPSIIDLQPVQNNSNPLYIREGNPDLKPMSTFTSQFSYITYNSKTSSSLDFRIVGTLMTNSRGTNNAFDVQTGFSKIKPENVNGNYILSASGNYSTPLKIKGLRLNSNLNVSNSRNANFINNTQNNTDRFGVTGGISFNYTYNDVLLMSFSNRTVYTDVKNSIRPANSDNYFTFNNTASMSLQLMKNWRLNSDMGQQFYLGRNDNFNRKIMIVNAGIQRYFMEKKQLSLEFRANDLLNQNSGISRVITDNRIEDTQVNNIRRYFSLKLTYKVNKIASKPAAVVPR